MLTFSIAVSLRFASNNYRELYFLVLKNYDAKNELKGTGHYVHTLLSNERAFNDSLSPTKLNRLFVH